MSHGKTMHVEDDNIMAPPLSSGGGTCIYTRPQQKEALRAHNVHMRVQNDVLCRDAFNA